MSSRASACLFCDMYLRQRTRGQSHPAAQRGMPGGRGLPPWANTTGSLPRTHTSTCIHTHTRPGPSSAMGALTSTHTGLHMHGPKGQLCSPSQAARAQRNQTGEDKPQRQADRVPGTGEPVFGDKGQRTDGSTGRTGCSTQEGPRRARERGESERHQDSECGRSAGCRGAPGDCAGPRAAGSLPPPGCRLPATSSYWWRTSPTRPCSFSCACCQNKQRAVRRTLCVSPEIYSLLRPKS